MKLVGPAILSGARKVRVLQLVGISGHQGPSWASGFADIELGGTAAGRRLVRGSGEAAIVLAGAAAGRRIARGSGATSLTVSAAASGRRLRYGAGSSALAVGMQGDGWVKPVWWDLAATAGQNATRQALYDQIIAYGGDLEAMASPPTITAGVDNAVHTIPDGVYWEEQTAGKYLYFGRRGQSNNGWQWRNITYVLPNGWGSIGGVWSAVYDGAVFEAAYTNNLNKFQVLVDGKLAGEFTTGGNNLQKLHKIDFGSAATREISIYHDGLGTCFRGIVIEPGRTLTALDLTRLRWAAVSDSFGEIFDGWVQRLAWKLGLGPYGLSSSLGGTGWVQDNVLRPNLYNRWPIDVNGQGPFDVIFVAVSANDLNKGTDATVGTYAATRIADARAEWPDALIFIIGPWDTHAPSAPEAGYASLKAVLQAVVAGAGPGVYWLDMEGVSYAKLGDNVHPSIFAGHETIATNLGGQVKTNLGIAA